MSWSAPNADDVLSELTPAEATVFQSVLGGSTPEQKITPILNHVVAEIRGYIRSGGYPLDSDTTKLPPSLLSDAIVITRWRVLVSFPQLTDLQSKGREKAYDNAMAKMEKIGQQKSSVEPPDSLTSPNDPAGNWNAENKLIMRTHPTPKPSVQITETPDDYANG